MTRNDFGSELLDLWEVIEIIDIFVPLIRIGWELY